MDPQGYDAGKKVTGRKRHIPPAPSDRPRAIRTVCAARYLECVTRRGAAVSFIDHAFGGDRSPMPVRLSVPAGVWSLSPPGGGRRCENGADRDDGKKHFHRMFHGSSPELWHRWVNGARINLAIRECIAFPPRSMNGLTPDKTSLATCENALPAWRYEDLGTPSVRRLPVVRFESQTGRRLNSSGLN
jgi:hypothetical protein